MRAPLSWIREFTPADAPVDELVAALNQLGLEVEGIEEPGREVLGVRVARILEVLPHPDADRLQLVDVEFGDGTTRVVCGAPNVAPGMLVPFAPSGASLRQRVLVVDDEPAIRSVACMLLEDANYTAVEAGSAEEAERCMDESGPFDVVLLDMTMPGTSGVELMARLKAKVPTLCMVLMSGYSEDLIHGRAPAGVPFLAKPFRGAGLIERIRETLSDGTHSADAVT